jgi:small subunit ribosomal protein S8
MAVSDPISDMLATIRNGQMARLGTVSTPASKLRKGVLEVLKSEGFIRNYSENEERKGVSRLSIELKYIEGEAAIKKVKKISTPGRRVYSAIDDLKQINNGLGIAILSTSKGVMADHTARGQNIGGEVLCSVF